MAAGGESECAVAAVAACPALLPWLWPVALDRALVGWAVGAAPVGRRSMLSAQFS